MASGVPTNRTNIDLPASVSNEILSKVQESSKVMRLARRMPLPGNGAAINVLLSDPEAAWVGETEKKTVSNPSVATKILRGYTLAVIVPFSNQFRRDASALYSAIVEKLPDALGRKFDKTVFGYVHAPGSDFDTLANVTAQSLASDVYQGLVAADTDIALHGGISNGYIFSAQGKGLLLGATDTTKRPIFNNVTENGVPVVLGARTEITKAAFQSGSPSKVGFAGDWNQAVWGMVEESVKINFSEDATLDLGDGQTINLFQQNMFAVRAEIEVGFRAITDVFNALTATGVPSV